jgi:hypothetical protein
MNYSDRELLAKTLQAEAGNQGIGGLLDVGSVIMNRVGQSGGSLRDVILKPAQFSAWNSVTGYAGGEQGQDMANMKPDARAYMVADNLLSGDYTDATGGATHYYNPSISNPDWGIKAGGNWAKRGDHVFGRPDGQPKMNIATGGQPMMQPEQKPKGLLGGFFSDPDRRARLAMGLEGMTLNPNQAFMSSLQGGIDKRAAGAEVEQKASKTIEALSRMNTPQAKAALEYLSAGGDPVAALKMAFAAPEGKVNQVTGASLGMTGPNADRLFNVAPDGKITAIGGSAPVTNVYPGGKGTGKFEELDASTLSDASSAAMAASRSLSQIDRLGDLLSNVDTGAAASLQSLAGSFGIKTEGLSDIEAAEALISALVPQQRQAGSGPMSDEDLKLFKKSLPQLMNTPEGNRIILQTLRGLAEYDVLGGKIVQQYRRNPETFTQADAFDALLARPDPFAQFRIAVPQPNAQPNVPASGSQTTSTGIKYTIKP